MGRRKADHGVNSGIGSPRIFAPSSMAISIRVPAPAASKVWRMRAHRRQDPIVFGQCPRITYGMKHHAPRGQHRHTLKIAMEKRLRRSAAGGR